MNIGVKAVLRAAALLAAPMALAGCQIVPEPINRAPPPPAGTTAFEMGVRAGPPVARLNLTYDDAASALLAFNTSCPVVLSREDASGLTVNSDWSEACAAFNAWPAADPQGFFARFFDTVEVGTNDAFATGYFEPEIAGSRVFQPGFAPVYAMPDDLVRAWPDDMPESERTGRAPLGRYDQSGKFVPYYTRAEIEDGALAGRGLELGWAVDPIELFFLQIQGSGRLAFADGSVTRIGYAGQNGHGYTGIGAPMRQRGLIGDGTDYPTSMQGIVQYLRDHPAEGRAIMRENESWIFFRELTGPNAAIGPIGSIGVPVRGRASVAVDPKYVPYGAPVWLDLDRDVADGLWVAQDTGGAIKGPNRFDTFWGAGAEAREIAGGMSGRGRAYILLPKAAARRLLAR